MDEIHFPIQETVIVNDVKYIGAHEQGFDAWSQNHLASLLKKNIAQVQYFTFIRLMMLEETKVSTHRTLKCSVEFRANR